MTIQKRLQTFRNTVRQVVAVQRAEAARYRVPPNPEYAQTAADHLDWLLRKHNASYTIEHHTDGNVRMLFQFPNGDVVSSGSCHSVPLAVYALRDKLKGK